MAEYRRGTGPQALPQGGAAAINAAQPPAAGPDQFTMGPGSEVPVEFASGPEVPDDERGLSENLQIMLGDPDPGYQPPLINEGRKGRLPQHIVRNLPALQAAAKAPDAPPALRAIYNMSIRQLELERLQGGR